MALFHARQSVEPSGAQFRAIAQVISKVDECKVQGRFELGAQHTITP